MSYLTIICENGHEYTNENQGINITCPTCNSPIGKIIRRVRPQDWLPNYDNDANLLRD